MAKRKTYRPTLASVEGKSSIFQTAVEAQDEGLQSLAQPRTVPLPPNVKLRDEYEEMLWDQFTSVRMSHDWTPLDLTLIGRLVRLEADIERHQDDVDSTSALIKTKSGNLSINPLITVIDMLTRRQMTIIRNMALTATTSDPRVIAAHANAQAIAHNAMKAGHAAAADTHAAKTRQLIAGIGETIEHE